MATGTISKNIIFKDYNETVSFASGIKGRELGNYAVAGYTPIAICPTTLERASTTVYQFSINSNGVVYMTTNASWNETNANIYFRITYVKN